MGVDVRLESERAEPLGKTVYDPQGRLAKAIATAKGACIGFIDQYGDTVFNQLQLPTLIKELEGLHRKASSDQREHIGKVLELLRTGLERPHVYARFIGD